MFCFVFFSSHVWMWNKGIMYGLCINPKEDWAPKNWCFWTLMLEKTLKVSWTTRISNQVNPKRNNPWIFIGRTDPEAEAPILWPLDAKSQLIGKDPDIGKDWEQEKEDRGWDDWMASLTQWTWVKKTLGDGEGQGSRPCCSPWGCRVGHLLANEQQHVWN